MGLTSGVPAVPGTASAPTLAGLGRRVHHLRATRGFSLQGFAQLAGLTAPALSALERGDEHAPVAALLAVAEALDLPVAALFDEEPQPSASVAPLRPSVPAPTPVPKPVAPARTAASSAPVPRTFADLRVGPLADRAFASLPEFAVAAVVEGGHRISVIASIFRVPSWRLEAWVRDGVSAPPRPTPIRRTPLVR